MGSLSRWSCDVKCINTAELQPTIISIFIQPFLISDNEVEAYAVFPSDLSCFKNLFKRPQVKTVMTFYNKKYCQLDL